MALYEAEIKVVPTGSFFRVEIDSGSLSTAKETIEHIYNPISIRNLRSANKSNSSTSSISAPNGFGPILVGIFGISALFLYFTPYILSVLYGAGATWMAQKITGQTAEEYVDIDDKNTTSEQHKKAAIVFGSALFFGMIGFIHGTAWNKDLNKEYNLDGKQAVVEQVRQK